MEPEQKLREHEVEVARLLCEEPKTFLADCCRLAMMTRCCENETRVDWIPPHDCTGGEELMNANDRKRAGKYDDKKQGFDDGGQEYPGPEYAWREGEPELVGCEPGATLLDHFAGLAMKQILAAPIIAPTPQHLAEEAYEYARAMVAEKRRLEGL